MREGRFDTDGRIDINLADAALLVRRFAGAHLGRPPGLDWPKGRVARTLPGIGPTIAQRIAEYREMSGPFGTTEDIQDVLAISPVTFEGMGNLITVSELS